MTGCPTCRSPHVLEADGIEECVTCGDRWFAAGTWDEAPDAISRMLELIILGTCAAVYLYIFLQVMRWRG